MGLVDDINSNKQYTKLITADEAKNIADDINVFLVYVNKKIKEAAEVGEHCVKIYFDSASTKLKISLCKLLSGTGYTITLYVRGDYQYIEDENFDETDYNFDYTEYIEIKWY